MSKDLENYNGVGDMDDNYPFTPSDDYDYDYDDYDEEDTEDWSEWNEDDDYY